MSAGGSMMFPVFGLYGLRFVHWSVKVQRADLLLEPAQRLGGFLKNGHVRPYYRDAFRPDVDVIGH